MEARTELPGVEQKDSNPVAGFYSSRDEATGETFDRVSVLGVCKTLPTGTIDNGGLWSVPAAGVKDQLMEELILGVGVKSRAQHAGRDFSRKTALRTKKSSERERTQGPSTALGMTVIR